MPPESEGERLTGMRDCVIMVAKYTSFGKEVLFFYEKIYADFGGACVGAFVAVGRLQKFEYILA